MIAAHLDKKLKALMPNETASFAIAYSGGGDSTALLHALKDHPQLKMVYILDHKLRDGSDVEAQKAYEFTKSLGLHAEILSWVNQGVDTAIQERARAARYSLIGQACREASIEYLLTGHHKDDQAETLFMRFEHKTGWRGAAGMAEMEYAPIWPEMAMVTILRPLLNISRKALMDYNNTHDLNWIEDPSNCNPNFERVRARSYLKQNPQMAIDLLEAQLDLREGLTQERRRLGKIAREHVTLDEQGIITARKNCPSELLYYLFRVASGEGRMIERSKIVRLVEFMQTARFTSATLGGALIRRNPSEHGFILCRDLVVVTGRKDANVPPKALKMSFTDKPQIWDGRYVFNGPSEYSVNSAYAARSLMGNMELKRLRDYPAAVRQTLPVVIKDGKVLDIGGQAQDETGPYLLKSLIKARLEATLGISLVQ
ncbi:MAG: tRNA lysidine(34) synthetase TilS [Litorimonas sp.]